MPTSCPLDAPPRPPDLAEVVAAWPTLPEAIRAGILAMVEVATPPDPPRSNRRGKSGDGAET